MDNLHSHIDINSEAFIKNKDHHLGLRNQLMEKLEKVKKFGGEKNVDRHHKRGKFLPRERIERILDDGSPFLELSSLAGADVYDSKVPSA